MSTVVLECIHFSQANFIAMKSVKSAGKKYNELTIKSDTGDLLKRRGSLFKQCQSERIYPFRYSLPLDLFDHLV